MIETYKKIISNQYEAAFCMLASCIDQCVDNLWQKQVIHLTFNQAVFHTLVFTDAYLGRDIASLRQQSFHQQNSAIFNDYEEFENRAPAASYSKKFIKEYLQHCREKSASVISTETVITLNHQSGFDWLKFSRAEVHVSNIRHIQHHAAQLSLHLKLNSQHGTDWVGSGWKEIKS